MVTALVVDPAALAWRDADPSSSFALRPRLQVSRDGAVLGVVGPL
jgi:hypothetical protein